MMENSFDRIEKVAVVGHRNPDTDSICSAIAYARLKNEIDPGRTYTPYRIGRINDETAYVLSYFETPIPQLLEDIKARVEDLEYRKTAGVASDISMFEAWKLLKERNIYTLPVTEQVDEAEGVWGKLLGIVTIQDIGRVYLDEMSASLLSRAETPIRNILKVLEGKLITGDINGKLNNGEVLIAAAEDEQFAKYMQQGDIAIVANRDDLQNIAIREGAGCLIVTLGSVVKEKVQDYARERGCIVISTEHNTFTTARLITQSIPVRFFMSHAKSLVFFSPNTYLTDVRKVMAKMRYRDFPVISENGRYMGMISRRFLLDAPRRNIVLVDHNEKAQSAAGVEEARILEIVDHHRLAPIETADPVTFRSHPVGSTSTIIYEIYKEKAVVPDRVTAGLLCASIISDTLLFRSPSTTEYDQLAAYELADIAELDIDAFAMGMFSAGTITETVDESNSVDLLLRDFKTFHVGDKDVGIGQINFPDGENLSNALVSLISALPEAQTTRRVDVIYVLLTDTSAGNSHIIFAGDGASDILESAFGEAPDKGKLLLKGVVSRKLQFVPEIIRTLH